MFRKIFIFIAFSSSLAACAGVKIFSAKSKTFITEEELMFQLPERGQVVLGEQHYQRRIQEAQGRIVENLVKYNNLQGEFSVCWEFLDYPKQGQVQTSFARYVADEINADQFLLELFTSQDSADRHRPYLAFFDAAKRNRGDVCSTNAPRAWKKVITNDGMDALDPKLIPPNFKLGSDDYYDRFVEAMRDHVPADKLANYFAAQSYTDSVMAWSMMKRSEHFLKFLIVGSFHSDYRDGVVASLKELSELPTVSIKLIDAEGMSEEEIAKLAEPHQKYGYLADYIYIIQ